MNQETVKLNYLHIAPRKVRQVANLLKGLTVNEAEAQLLVHPQRVSKPLLVLLRSATANAVHNKKMNSGHLMIESIRVDQGPSTKRFLPRAMGRATSILKRTSHITLILKEIEKKTAPRFNIIAQKSKKTKKKEKKGKIKQPIPQAEVKQKEKPKEKAGFFRRIFRRKSM